MKLRRIQLKLRGNLSATNNSFHLTRRDLPHKSNMYHPVYVSSDDQYAQLFNASMKAIDPLPKRLIICCDGTWQSSVSGKRNIPSNVTRLARTIAKAGEDRNGKQWQQLVHYDPGVGTGALSFLEQATQGATGEGLVENVLEAYNFLVNNYAPGDQIFCFGFSRGAFTARAIAGLVTDIGVFKPSNMQAFAPLWALYRRNLLKQDFRKSKEYFEFMNGVRPMVPEGEEKKEYVRKAWEMAHRSELSKVDPLAWPQSHIVEVVGVFDTVGSLGMGDTRISSDKASRRAYEWLNVKLSPFINHAFHALALDERRAPFIPTLYYIPNEKTLQKEDAIMAEDAKDYPELKAHQEAVNKMYKEHRANHPADLYQVWFPGVHINIGGGNDGDIADAEGLSNVSFAWMVQQLGPYLAFEPWTWDEITRYQKRVMKEEKLYQDMKANMTPEEEEEYGSLVERSKLERLEAWAAKTLGMSKKPPEAVAEEKQVKLVPVLPQFVKDPPDDNMDNVKVLWACSEIQDSYTAMYKAMGNPKNRSPGQCGDQSRVDFTETPIKNFGATNEFIHPSVWWRYQTMWKLDGRPDYRSRALEGFKRLQDPKYGGWGYYKESSKTWIPEWFMKTTNKYLDDHQLQQFADADGDENWEHAEWLYIDTVTDKDKLQPELAKVYVDAQKAKKAMENDKKVFPWDVTI